MENGCDGLWGSGGVDEVEEIVLFDIVGKSEAAKVFPSGIGSELVNDEYVVNAACVKLGDNSRADKPGCSCNYNHLLVS